MKPIYINNQETGYYASEDGRIYSTKNSIFLQSRVSKLGYSYVTLMVNKKKCGYTVHRLIAKAFILNPENLPHVNHLDNCKTNNAVSNLEWVTIQGNSDHKVRQGRQARGVNNNKAKLSESQVLEIRKLYAYGNITQVELAKLYSVTHRVIGRNANRDTWKHI